jgi:acetyl esterase/lipase
VNRGEFLFEIIDVLGHFPQNYIKVKDIIIEKNMAYSLDFYDRKMDLLYRKTTEQLPILINIHGGGFVKGDKKHRWSLCSQFADKNWFVINANHRLAPKYPFPAMFEDMFALLAILPELALKYNLDTSKIVLTGDSAGAYIAAYTVALMTNDSLRLALSLPKIELKPAGLIGFCGPYDIVKALSAPLAFGLVECLAESFSGVKLSKGCPELATYPYAPYLSPVDFVTENWCPSLLVYAEKDIFCAGLEAGLFNAIKDVGVYVDEIHSSTSLANHCYHLFNWLKITKNTLEKCFEFLDTIKSGHCCVTEK